ncbi:MAG TPA: hypothetical protein VM597_21660 [Gemmataceae bacterium]|jgi:hypothetical protein|nr:hypothetical protein [Gemmataceae bacterium]
MKYQVVWDRLAEEELAAIWLAASDRNAVTRASEWLERRLAVNPLDLGESRRSSVERIGFYPPLGIEFEVIEDDLRVVV